MVCVHVSIRSRLATSKACGTQAERGQEKHLQLCEEGIPGGFGNRAPAEGHVVFLSLRSVRISFTRHLHTLMCQSYSDVV